MRSQTQRDNDGNPPARHGPIMMELHEFSRTSGMRPLGTQHMTCVHERPMFMGDPSPVLAPAPAL
eukprot:16433955-Heterocapsa_arctica.AAC.1